VKLPATAIRRDEDELRILVHEFLDEPRASYAIDLNVLAGNPFHVMPPINRMISKPTRVTLTSTRGTNAAVRPSVRLMAGS
jgi:hypothetical protein